MYVRTSEIMDVTSGEMRDEMVEERLQEPSVPRSPLASLISATRWQCCMRACTSFLAFVHMTRKPTLALSYYDYSH